MFDAVFKEKLLNVIKYSSKDSDAAIKRIEERYGAVKALFAADLDELSDISELGEQGAYLIRICFSLASRRVTDLFKFGRIHTEEEILEYFKALFLCKTNECVYCMFFDESGRTISCDFITEGTINSTDVLPRKMIELAIKKKAASMIIAHNHPGGIATASCEDIDVTGYILKLFSASGRKLLCHYVIAGNLHYKIDTVGVGEN